MFNILLQVLDDGRLTDGQGRTVDFANTLIVMTSNLGGDILAAQPPGEDSGLVRDQVMAVVRGAFRPEFLNRLDEILLFHRLAPEHMAGVVTIQLQRLEKRLADRDIALDVTDAARLWLAERGYDPSYGARPLKRLIQRTLENPLAMCLLEGEIVEGGVVRVDVDDSGLTIDGRPASAWAA